MINKSNKFLFSSLVLSFLLLSTLCFAENSAQQAQIDKNMAEAKIEQLKKKQVKEYSIDGVDSVDARKTSAEIAEQEAKLIEAEKRLAETKNE